MTYRVYFLNRLRDGADPASIACLEVLEITSLEEYQLAIATPAFEKLLGEWSEFVASAEAIHGPVVE